MDIWWMLVDGNAASRVNIDQFETENTEMDF